VTGEKEKTLLLVEDEAVIAMLEMQQLKAAGYKVIHVSSGQKAIDLVCHKNEAVDLILMDIDLGKGIDGTETAQEILKTHKIPILFLSSHTEKEIVEKTEKITSFGYVVKDTGSTVLETSIKMAFRLYNVLNERRQAEEALKASEELYRYMFENNPQPMFIYDLDTLNIIQVNKSAIQHYGYSPDEFIGLNIKDIRPKEDIARLMENIAKARKDINGKGEWRHRKKNGEIINVEVSAHSVIYNNRKARYVLINDITVNKKAEEALKKSEAKYQELYKLYRLLSDTMPDMLWAKDKDKKYLFANKAICEKLLNAIDPVEPIGKTDIYFAERERSEHPENPHWHTFGELCQDSDSITLRELKEMQFDEFGNVKGKFLYLDVRKAPLFNDAGELIGIVGTARDITENKLAEEALKESEEKYRLLTESIKDVIWTVDVGTKLFTYVSPSVQQLRGFTPEEIIARPVAFSLPPQNVDSVYKLLEERARPLLNDASTLQTDYFIDEIRQPHKNGSYIWTEVITKIIRNKKTGKIELHGVTRDISKRKKAEAALLEKEKNYSEIFNSTSEAIFIDEVDTGKMIDVNNTMINMYGYNSKEEVLAGNIGDLSANIEPYSEEYAQELIRKTITIGPQTFEWLAKKKDGTVFWVEMTLKKTEIGGQNRILAVGRDITARKNAETELKESELKYRLLIDHTSDLIWSINAAGFFIYVSPSWKRVTGYEPEALTGTSFRLLIHSDDVENFNEFINEIINTKQILQSPEYRVLHFDGTIHWHSATATPVLGIDREFVNMVCVSRDITERKIDEEKILNLLREKEVILKEVHHRIKNNMNTIYALLLLQSDLKENESSKNSLIDAAGRVQSMMILYDRLYRSEYVNEVPIDEFLPSIIDQIIKLFPQTLSVNVKLELNHIVLKSQILSPLGIIINELFTNAMKYAFKGRDNNIIKISAVKKENTISIVFEDNGIGLPDSVTSMNSSGFGLQLIDMLVQQLEGSVKIERNNGTKFIIEFLI